MEKYAAKKLIDIYRRFKVYTKQKKRTNFFGRTKSIKRYVQNVTTNEKPNQIACLKLKFGVNNNFLLFYYLFTKIQYIVWVGSA